MKFPIQFFLLSSLNVASIINAASCNADDCARAVTGTRNATRNLIAKSDCSSFVRQTVVQANRTSTVTVSATSLITAKVKRALDYPVNTVPAYASACSGSVRYSSACSCFDVTAATTTYIAAVTVTVTGSATKSPYPIVSSYTAVPGNSTSPDNTTTPGYTPIPDPISPPGSVYSPSIPATYDGCMLDPRSSTSFLLLDAGTAHPIIKNGGLASIPTQMSNNRDPFHFSKPPNALAGLYDVVIESSGTSSYLAIFSNNTVGFTSVSSNGQAYAIADNGDKFITTAFFLDCYGYLTGGIFGKKEFDFQIVDNNVVVGTNSTSTKQKKDVVVPKGFYVLPNTPDTKSRLTTRDDPSGRCPNPALIAVVKPSAPPPSSNGCGPNKYVNWFIPQDTFGACCDKHDFCYDDCTQSFGGCNDAFARCNFDTCARLHPSNRLFREACDYGAAFYSRAVKTDIAKGAFTSATDKRCDCRCPDPQAVLCPTDPNYCVDVNTDLNNCGTCSNVCGYFETCYEAKCKLIFGGNG